MLRFAEPHIYTSVDDSLVLWISGRGRGVGSKVFDLSGKGNHGTIYGATWKNTPLGHSVLSFDGVDDYCFSEDTEVLTRQGWKKVFEVSYKDEIATLNPETDELEYQRPSRLFNFEYNGEMCHFYGRHLDLLVTPDHNIYVSRYKSGADRHPYRLEKARNVLTEKYLKFRTISDEVICVKGKLVDYDGRVYGITVPKYHIIYVCRNGKACWAGNCDCGNDESLQVGSCFTYEMWLKAQVCPDNWPIWLGNKPHVYFAIRQDKGASLYRVRFEWGLPPYDGSTYTSILLIPPDKMSYKWFHVVATYDGDTVKGYRNGEFVDSKSGQTLNTALFTVYINQYKRGIGLVGEVRIYNRALSEEEVMERYQKTKHLYGY